MRALRPGERVEHLHAILAARAGHWQVDVAQGLMFDETVPEAAVSSYNTAIEDMTRIGAEQEALQKQMMSR